MKNLKIFFWITLIAFRPLNASFSDKFVIGAHGPFGFFSIFLGTLANISWAKKNKKNPVVYWSNNCLYYQNEGYNGSKNAWEYYFQPVSDLQYVSGDKQYKSYYAPDNFSVPYWKGCYNSYFHKTLKFQLNNLIKEYVTIKMPIQRKINRFFNNNMKGKKNIGIHLRGTDKKAEAKPIDPFFILNSAKNIAHKFPNKYNFFIATDDQKLLNFAKEILKKNVVFYDSHRSTNGLAVHYPKNENAAILGEEILIEAILLSKCEYLIHTRSNVATAVMLFNPEIKNVFLEN